MSEDVHAALRSRIVGEGELDPREIEPHPLNWRRHPDTQRRALERVLERVGWVQRVIINRRTGRLIDGHLRVELALARGERVPVLYVDLDPEEERYVLAILDPLAAIAEADRDLLAQVVDGIAIEDEIADALAEVVGVEEELAAEAAGGPGGSVREPIDPVGVGEREVDRLREEYGTEPGQVWRAGETVTLVIGDATDPDSYAPLDVPVEAVWTDPPYGVDLGAKNDYLQSIGRARSDVHELEHDDLDPDSLRSLLYAAFRLAIDRQREGGAWYVAAPAGPLQCVFGSVLADLGVWRQTIVWVKNNPTFAPLGVTYHWGHEPLLYGWKPGGAHRDYTGRTESTVWEIPRPAASPLHPSTKPVELVARALRHSTRPGDLVLDPFAGSGTTAVAAAQMGRRAYLIEIDPAYAAAAIHRLRELGLEMRRDT